MKNWWLVIMDRDEGGCCCCDQLGATHTYRESEKAHSPDAGHASGLRAQFASLQLTGNDLPLGLQLPGQTFKLQLLERWDRGGNVVYLLTATLVVIASGFFPRRRSLKGRLGVTGGLCDGKTGALLCQFPTLAQQTVMQKDLQHLFVTLRKTEVQLGVVNKSWRIWLSDKQSNRLDSFCHSRDSEDASGARWGKNSEKRIWHFKICGINLIKHQIIKYKCERR